MAKVHQI